MLLKNSLIDKFIDNFAEGIIKCLDFTYVYKK